MITAPTDESAVEVQPLDARPQSIKDRIEYWRLALHESGHAVAAHYTGGTPLEIALNSEIGFSINSPPNSIARMQVVSAGGIAAENIYLGNFRRGLKCFAPDERFKIHQPTAEHAEMMVSAIGDYTRQAQLYEDDNSIEPGDALRSAMKILKRHWSTVLALAREAFVNGHLGENEIAQIIKRLETESA